MKRVALVALAVCMLAGCGMANEELDRAMELRAKLIAGHGCSFDAAITADYGDKLYNFAAQCEADREGNLTFTITEPETIAGITGDVSGSGGNLTFEDTALAFEHLADDQLAPVSAPWLFLKTLQSGNVTSCGTDGDLVRVSIDESYADDALRLDVWLGEGNLPVRAEILYRDRRILSLEIKSFNIL